MRYRKEIFWIESVPGVIVLGGIERRWSIDGKEI
jgi:hypothetical protein